MKFHANSRRRAIEYEKDLVQYWKKNKTFEKSIEQRPEDNSYVFYDGPPFITGVPHHGTLLSSVVKDAIPRYQTMKGKRVERVWGWDTHGLPAENFVEKKLGIQDRHDIGTKVSLEEYITTARESMIETGNLWESTIDRIGRWVDFQGAYKTMDKDYMESVWWAFKQLYEKGKIYEGERVLMYDTKWATPLSKAEVTMDAGAYVDVTDPSVYVKFNVVDEAYSLLAWTTTPWTLPGNVALAVNTDVTYVEVVIDGEHLVLAEELLPKVLTDEKHQPLAYEMVRSFEGSELVGKSYEPLFDDRGENAHRVWAADYVTTESGTGIVHLAPAYGEEDFVLAKEKGIPVIHVLDEYGMYTEGPWEGLEVWENNKRIAKELKEQGVVWKIDYIRHEYPHNPRTGHRLMYRAHPSWFMDIDGQRTEMLEQNTENINWFPEHIKHGRFEKTVEQAPDWNLSRDRFWATAMPVWKGVDEDGVEHVKVVGSYQELKELSGVELEDYHRPWVDDITFDLDGVHYTRIDKVLDCWFESGSMPFAQFHYPFENVEKFEANFPGDFIVEYVGQVRAWFYYVHAVNVGLFGHNAFKNVIVTGNVAGNDGRKMSKSLGNFTDPNELMDKYSADSLRFLLLASPLLSGEDFALQDKDVGDVARKLSMIWNMYDFFTMYADVDGWEFDGNLKDPSSSVSNPLDQWIISRVHQLIQEIETHLDNYDVASAVKPILPFIDDASNWFVRRSRRRFWKSEDDGDKKDAYQTLHYVLVRLAQAIAPFTPFLAEELYQKLTGEESVHLTDWPEVGHVNELVLERMARTRDVIEQGLGLRMYKDEQQAQIKIRQPLASLTYCGEKLDAFYETIIAEEVNVKAVVHEVAGGSSVALDKTITPELLREGQSREVIRFVQSARKKAGLNVDDRISLSLVTDDAQLRAAIDEHAVSIAHETLAEAVSDATYAHTEAVKIDGVELTLSLEKQ
ncbi:isoleucine--tRNA ligase [Candidatus Saccharibacteria bacterium]|nr:isoleucine--tRNA ligase [Candidatus Saccharibacteria bacterium]|tara:strand:- start:2 stop:2890 length:2889 start_codon:yes stop_codon:yes gene_type:complete